MAFITSKMKRFLLLLALLCWAEYPSFGADASQLELKIELLRQRYCRGDAEIGFVRLEVRLTLRNVGKRGVLLPQGGAYIYRVMLANSEKAYRERTYIESSGVTEYRASTAGPEGEERDNALYFLAPAATRTGEDGGFFSVKFLPNKRISPEPGEYWLGVSAGTWSPRTTVPPAWEREPGLNVFTGTVTSLPIPIRIDPGAQFDSCQ